MLANNFEQILSSFLKVFFEHVGTENVKAKFFGLARFSTTVLPRARSFLTGALVAATAFQLLCLADSLWVS